MVEEVVLEVLVEIENEYVIYIFVFNIGVKISFLSYDNIFVLYFDNEEV